MTGLYYRGTLALIMMGELIGFMNFVAMEETVLRDLAIQRMKWLFRLGVEAARENRIDLARRYGELIRLISQRTRIKIPKRIKRWICKNCNSIMVPGITARIRIRRDGAALRVVTTCLACGYIHRYEFVERKRRDHNVEKESKGAQEAESSSAQG